MTSSPYPHPQRNLADLATRAYVVVPSIYRLVAILSSVFCLLLLTSSAADHSIAELIESIQSVQRHGVGYLLFLMLIGAALFVVLFRILNHRLGVLVGLTLFATAWRLGAFGGVVQACLLLPFCGYFWLRSKSEPPLRNIIVLAASILTLQVAALPSDLAQFPHAGFAGTTLFWAAWIWTVIGSVFAINLGLGWWHTRPMVRPNRPADTTKLPLVPAATVMAPQHTLIAPVQPVERSTDARPLTPATFTNPAIAARFTFTDVIGMEPITARLLHAGRDAMAGHCETNGILLFGLPGNGKTFLAEALAGEMGVPMILVNFGTVASRFVNETTQAVMQVFDDAVGQAPCLLFIDEVEALLSNRTSMADGAGEYSRTACALLARLVNIRGKGVVLAAATNHLDRLDPAAVREGRFDTKIEITPPDDPARQALIGAAVMEAGDNVAWPASGTLVWLSKHWAGFSVSRIRAAARLAGRWAGQQGLVEVPVAAYQEALREVQGHFGDYVPDTARGLETLHFDGQVGQRLADLAQEMQDSFAFEQHGGRITSGVLFFGPPGTGKTIAVKALAKSAGWALIYVDGTELCQQPERIKSLIARAVDIKPCVIFIDEADALIADRRQSWSATATNAFLTETGDDRESLRDVLLIAATNQTNGVDAAMLRGGRFSQQWAFTLPTSATIVSFLNDELTTRPVMASDTVLKFASTVLTGQSLADVKAALDRACNGAARRAMQTMPCLANTLNTDRAQLATEDFEQPHQCLLRGV